MAHSSSQPAPSTVATIDMSGLSEMESRQLDHWCHFCGRTQSEVEKLIAGQGVYICDICTIELTSPLPAGAHGTVVELPLAQPVDRPEPGYFLTAVALGLGDATRQGATTVPKAVPESEAERAARIGGTPSRVPLRCSFCGKSQQQVRALFYAGFSYICDECVHLCGEIIEDERATAAEAAT